jgi:hypothetical protein
MLIKLIARWEGAPSAQVLRLMVLPLTERTLLLRYQPTLGFPYYKSLGFRESAASHRMPKTPDDIACEVCLRLVALPPAESPFRFLIRAWQEGELLSDLYARTTDQQDDVLACLFAREFEGKMTLVAATAADCFRLMPLTAYADELWSPMQRMEILALAAATYYTKEVWNLIKHDVASPEPPRSWARPRHEVLINALLSLLSQPQPPVKRGGRNALDTDEWFERMVAAMRIEKLREGSPKPTLKEVLTEASFRWGTSSASRKKAFYEARHRFGGLSKAEQEKILAEI